MPDNFQIENDLKIFKKQKTRQVYPTGFYLVWITLIHQNIASNIVSLVVTGLLTSIKRPCDIFAIQWRCLQYNHQKTTLANF